MPVGQADLAGEGSSSSWRRQMAALAAARLPRSGTKSARPDPPCRSPSPSRRRNSWSNSLPGAGGASGKCGRRMAFGKRSGRRRRGTVGEGELAAGLPRCRSRTTTDADRNHPYPPLDRRREGRWGRDRRRRDHRCAGRIKFPGGTRRRKKTAPVAIVAESGQGAKAPVRKTGRRRVRGGPDHVEGTESTERSPRPRCWSSRPG